jgi:vacuolar protein 8
VYSDNVDLQRSASLTFAEITERGTISVFDFFHGPSLQPPDVREVGRDTLDPILFLLQNNDTEVQRAASAALGNLAVNSMFGQLERTGYRANDQQPRTKSRL